VQHPVQIRWPQEGRFGRTTALILDTCWLVNEGDLRMSVTAPAHSGEVREALRCLKRQLARVVFKTILGTEQASIGEMLRAQFTADCVAIAV
jgi:hypothetical protein